MREFTVKKGVRGYVVTIGCQVAGFSTKEDLNAAVSEYINDPEGTEEKYYYLPPGMPREQRDNRLPQGPSGIQQHANGAEQPDICGTSAETVPEGLRLGR